MDFTGWEVLVSWPSFVLELIVFLIALALHRLYLSDLSDIPGPFWASITRLWHVWIIFEGEQNLRLKALHEKHGHFVRIAPNEVSVSHTDGSTLLLRADLDKVIRNSSHFSSFISVNYLYRVTGIVLQQFPTSVSRIPCQRQSTRRKRLFRSIFPPVIPYHKF